MSQEFKDQKVLIAGSSSGLGFSIAKNYEQTGAQIWLSGRNREKLEKASAELNHANFTVCDLETSTGRKTLLEEVKKKWGKLDSLILNIGSGKSQLGTDSPLEEWIRVFNLNLFSHVELIQLFKENIKQSVVSISSLAGHENIQAPYAYSAAKAALNHFVYCSAQELFEKYGIRYNAVSPGNILIKAGRWEELEREKPDQVRTYIQRQNAMRRFADPDEIANAVLFLSSSMASFCNGTILRVDGGSQSLKF